MKRVIHSLAVVGLFVGAGIQSAQSALVYESAVQQWNAGTYSDTTVGGTNYAFRQQFDPYNPAILINQAEIEVTATSIFTTGYHKNFLSLGGNLNQSFFRPVSEILFDDIIFSDTLNPGGGGTATVGLNFLSSASFGLWQTYITINGAVAFSGSDLANGSYNSNTVVVPLDTPINMSFYGSFRLFDPVGAGDAITGSGELSLGLNPFNLSSGITANSVDANIVNNTLSPVPVPAAAWLFASGLIGLLGTARRKIS